MKIVGFTGLAGSGKDTAARVFEDHGYVHLKMAGALKLMLRSLLLYQGVDELMADRLIDGDLKEVPQEALCGRTPRHAMQSLGTEWGRDLIAHDLWVSATAAQCVLHPAVVISDIRFPNEVRMVRLLGGKVYRIDRGLPPTDPHPSEALVLSLEVDSVVENRGSKDEFWFSMAALVEASKAA